MASLKKCPNCQKWSQWSQSLEDRCEHCHALLSPQEIKDKEEQEERIKQEENDKFKVKLIEVKPGDNLLLVIIKRVIQGFQLIFVGIVSFLVWLATIVAG